MANPKILVVEDEPLILMLCAEILRDAGFDVIEAVTVDEAVALLDTLAPQLALIFSDIETPGELDGLNLVEWVTEKWPELPVLLTSGRRLPPPSLLTKSARFVAKPYELAHVCTLIKVLTTVECAAD